MAVISGQRSAAAIFRALINLTNFRDLKWYRFLAQFWNRVEKISNFGLRWGTGFKVLADPAVTGEGGERGT